MKRLVLALPLVLLARLAGAEPPSLTAAQRAELESGAVVLEEVEPTGDRGNAYRTFAVIDAPPRQVWPVVRDCEALDEFMPRMARAEETERSEDSYVCEVEIELPFPLENRVNSARSFLEELPGGVYRRHWSLVSGHGHYRRNDGSWTAYPWGEDGGRTLLVNFMDVWLETQVPDFVIAGAQTVQAPAVFDAIRERVRSLAKQVGVGDSTEMAAPDAR